MSLFRRGQFRVAAIIAAGALACTGQSDIGPNSPAGTAHTALTALPRDLSTSERSIVDAANGFSFSLWAQLVKTQRDSNVFVSPLSASFSLGMTMNGAANHTLDEMRSTLGFGAMPIADVDAGYKSLIALLTSLDPTTTMQIANSIWYANGFPFKKSFLDAGSTYFDATINPLNFGDVSGSLSKINGWVSDKTNGKIPTIVSSIDPGDVMFLINAIYFKSSWRSRFDASLTQTSTFHGAGGDQSAKLMHKSEEHMGYASTSAFQAVDLAYGDSAYTMTVILPSSNTTVDAVAASLTADSWRQLAAALHPAVVTLDLPKFTLSWQRALIPDLESLGIHDAFGLADFSNMADPAAGPLYISSVVQKTFVDVNEEGTEAAAATSTGVTVTSAPVSQTVRVDRPFIIAIRERLSGTVLFMGKIVRLAN